MERALGARPVSARPVAGGFTANRRFVVELPDERRAFVKWAYSDASADWLRVEHGMYRDVGAEFMPRLLGWDDEDAFPLLAIEDLSDAHWPPPWRDGEVEAVRAALAAIAATPPPPGLPRAEEVLDVRDWERVRADPEPFLSLDLRTRGWLDGAYDTLVAAAQSVPLHGDALCHFDVRSDNICLRDGRALLVDWNWACVGNPEADLSTWLPSLHLEGGPPPWEVLPAGGAYAAWLSGFWGYRAGLPAPEGANPSVRDLQRRQLAVTLDWAERELDLPPTLQT